MSAAATGVAKRMIVVKEKHFGSQRVFDGETPAGLKKAREWINEMKALLPGLMDGVHPGLVVEVPTKDLYAGMFTEHEKWTELRNEHASHAAPCQKL